MLDSNNPKGIFEVPLDHKNSIGAIVAGETLASSHLAIVAVMASHNRAMVAIYIR